MAKAATMKHAAVVVTHGDAEREGGRGAAAGAAAPAAAAVAATARAAAAAAGTAAGRQRKCKVADIRVQMQLQLERALAIATTLCAKHMHVVGAAMSPASLARQLGDVHEASLVRGRFIRLPAGGREPHALRLARGTRHAARTNGVLRKQCPAQQGGNPQEIACVAS